MIFWEGGKSGLIVPFEARLFSKLEMIFFTSAEWLSSLFHCEASFARFRGLPAGPLAKSDGCLNWFNEERKIGRGVSKYKLGFHSER